MSWEKPSENENHQFEKAGKLEYALKSILRPAKYLGELIEDTVRKNEIL